MVPVLYGHFQLLGENLSFHRTAYGGKKFCTTIDTLTQREPDSMLAAMFSGRHAVHQESDKGYVFVDRDGTYFRHILNWLRDGVVPTLKDSEYSELLREAEYFQLLGLMDGINASLIKRKEDEEMTTELKRIDIIKCIQSERVRFRGLNLSGPDLSKLDLSFVDFSYACLKNVFFSRANLQCAKFRTADLTNANLEGANLEGANLKGAKLTNANLKGANLQRAYLRHVNLRDTDLEGAKLYGANLLGAIR
ncbi:UNVERIFIED_CONTAM: FH protein interacting protein FIP2 [Sesamum radiatum]|uniref:FH protein interacting protein FIP2 n=1 Tax=Sesamum radiatum TaxID=300843 RepID=A0AAW2R4E8_SESRA